MLSYSEFLKKLCPTSNYILPHSMFPAALIWLWTIYPAFSTFLQNTFFLSSMKTCSYRHSILCSWNETSLIEKMAFSCCFTAPHPGWTLGLFLYPVWSIRSTGHVDLNLSSDNLLIIDWKLCSHSPFPI